MSRWQSRMDEWLSAEQRDREEAADAAFAQVFQALPDIEPSADFVRQAADAAWQARARSRRRNAMVTVAASVLAVVAAGAVAYGLVAVAGGWVLSTGASLATSLVVWGLWALTAVAGWGWAAAQVGSALAGVLVMPQGAAVLTAVACVGLAALYMLQRVLRFDIRLGNRGVQCFL